MPRITKLLVLKERFRMYRFAAMARLALAVTFAVLNAAAVQAEPAGCRRINSLPAVINSPGSYCLTESLSTSISIGPAINITVDGVVLDLGGFALDGSAAGSGSQADGVRASGRRDVTVRNGVGRGFFQGVVLAGGATAQGYVVEQIAAEDNFFTGIGVESLGALVRDNRVIHTGGSTSPLANGNALGIALGGLGSRALNNDVVDTFAAPGHNAWSIHATNADRAVIEGNRVSRGVDDVGTTYGIIVPFSQDVLVVDNRINGTTIGVSYSSGATGKYRDNLTFGVTTPFEGSGTDAGNNQ
jgi:hypothetical protein